MYGARSFEHLDQFREVLLPGNDAHEDGLIEIALVFDVDVIPAGHLAHDFLDGGAGEFEEAVLPGEGLIYVGIGDQPDLAADHAGLLARV